MLRRIKHQIRTYFLTGLLVVVPLGLIIFILKFVIGKLDDMLGMLPLHLHPQTYIPVPIPGLSLIITIIIVFLVGVFTTNFVGRKLVRIGEVIVDKIPLVRSIYVAVKQLLETLFSQDKESFKKVVMVEYPRKGLYSVGFVTGNAEREIQKNTASKVVSVFVPTSPNPTSGYLIMVPEEDLTVLDINVETAFKLVLSGGVVTSENQVKENE